MQLQIVYQVKDVLSIFIKTTKILFEKTHQSNIPTPNTYIRKPTFKLTCFSFMNNDDQNEHQHSFCEMYQNNTRTIRKPTALLVCCLIEISLCLNPCHNLSVYQRRMVALHTFCEPPVLSISRYDLYFLYIIVDKIGLDVTA